jgi:hypothetical protein
MPREIGLLFSALLLCIHSGQAFTQTETPIPSAQAIVKLATEIEFSSTAVTDEPVPVDIRKLNPKFQIEVFYRTGPEKVEFAPADGAVFAKVSIKGVPKERDLPDGEYYLWIGGKVNNLRAVLVTTDARVVREMEVLSRPSVAEEEMPHSPKVHAVAEAIQGPGTKPPPGPKPPPQKPSPPKPAPTKPAPTKPAPPLPRRSYREICVRPAPTDHGQGGGKKWVRVPDN